MLTCLCIRVIAVCWFEFAAGKKTHFIRRHFVGKTQSTPRTNATHMRELNDESDYRGTTLKKMIIGASNCDSSFNSCKYSIQRFLDIKLTLLKYKIKTEFIEKQSSSKKNVYHQIIN